MGSWPHVTVGDHRFGGTGFRIGPREFGHVHARFLLRLSYLSRVSVLRKTPADADEWGGVDVEAELAQVNLSEPVLAAFVRRTVSA